MVVSDYLKELSFYFSRPAKVQVDITNHCNLDCRYCYNKASAFLGKEMTDEELRHVIKNVIQQLDPVVVSFSGGEPFVRKNLLLECAKMLKENGIQVSINTNGLLLNGQTIRAVKSIGVDSVNINIESLSEKRHDSLRGAPGALRRTLANLAAFKRIWDLKRVSISVVVNRENLDDLVGIANFVKENGFGSLHFIDMMPTSNNDSSLSLRREDWLRFFSIYKEIEKMRITVIPNHALLFMTNFKEKKGDVELPFCMACRLKMVICADGSIVPCDYFKDKAYVCGNALKDNLLDVWKNAGVMDKFRYSLDGYDECRSCSEFGSCGGGCKALANAVSGNPFSPDPYCKVFKLRASL